VTNAQRTNQGDADGLCGIYCLINFMRSWRLGADIRKSDRESFKYLMRSAEQLSVLTPDRLHDGFEWHELTDIFNKTAQTLREPYKAIPFVHVKAQIRDRSIAGILAAIMEQKGQAVLSVDKGEHWVLATEFKSKKVKIVDPSRRTSRQSIALSSIDSDHAGLALLPTGSSLRLLD
jgi:hypothetical protein